MAAIGVHPLGVQLFNPSLIVKLYTGLPHILADKIPGPFQDFSRTICQTSRTFVLEKLN